MKIVLQSNRLCVDHIIAVFSSMSWHLIIFIIFQTRIIRSTICSSPQLYEECLRHERKWKIAVENLLSIFFSAFSFNRRGSAASLCENLEVKLTKADCGGNGSVCVEEKLWRAESGRESEEAWHLKSVECIFESWATSTNTISTFIFYIH